MGDPREYAGSVARLVVLAIGALLTAASAGSPPPVNAFGPTEFRSTYGFDVVYLKGTRLVLPKGWMLDNYHRQRNMLVEKTAGTYTSHYQFDADGNGAKEAGFTEPTYALRLEHSSNDGVIWLRTIPMHPKYGGKDARVLMQAYLDAVAGGSYEAVKLEAADQAVVVERRYAATVVDRGPVLLAGRKGYAVTADIANLDQIRVDPNARERRVRLIIARSPIDNVKSPFRLPVLIVVGYSNIPEDFDAGLADFEDMLQRITIAGQAGVEKLSTPDDVAPTQPDAPAEPPTME
jgi:hypothetical protein